MLAAAAALQSPIALVELEGHAEHAAHVDRGGGVAVADRLVELEGQSNEFESKLERLKSRLRGQRRSRWHRQWRQGRERQSGVPEVPHTHGGAFLGGPLVGGGHSRRQRISHA
jgi:hypothetical protein